MKLRFKDVEREDVHFKTGTCELCFGSKSGTEETLVFVDQDTGEEYRIENFYYTAWDHFLETLWEIDNYPKFAEWFAKQPVAHVNIERHIRKCLDEYLGEQYAE